MGNLRKIKEDSVTLNKGKWFDWVDGIRLLIASSNCSGYQVEMERQALTRASADLTENQEAIQSDMRIAAGKFLLLGWENIQDDDGKDIPYSPEQSIKWLCNEDYFPLYRFVRDKATNDKNFRKAEAKVVGK
jgi:hypothetical protein